MSDLLRRARSAISPVWDHRIAGPVLRIVLGYVLVVQVVLQYLFGKMPLVHIGRGNHIIPTEIVLLGLVYGSLYALIGMGIILVYRANRIINFAQAQLGAVPAVIALLLIAKRGVPWVVALPIAVIGGALLGGAVEVGLVRRFSNAPRMILTVVTIGIGFVLLVLEFYSKQWVGGSLIDSVSLTFPTPFSDFNWTIGVFRFRGDHIAPVVVVSTAVLALGAFFKYTDVGIAVRAAAENGERASLLGIPVKRVSTIVWMLAATMSAIGVFFTVPLTGLPLDGFVGLRLLFMGLAIAVMARMESLPLAFVSGLLVGIVDQSIVFTTNRAGLSDPAIFVVILLALLVQRGKLSRAYELGASSWQSVKEVRPIPAELRSVPEVRTAISVLSIILAVVVLGIPFWLGDAYTSSATLALIYAIIGVSLVVLTGWAGQISLGQFAIAGVASATAGGLAANHHLDFFLTIIVAGFVGAAIAVAVGLPALRIQGLFLAVTTLGFAFTVSSMLNREYFGWLVPKSGHLVNRPVLWGSFDLGDSSELGPITFKADAKFYYVALAFLVLALVMARSLRRNRSGRVLIGVRDNGRAAQAFGINLARSRLAAFAVSGLMAGMAGGLLAYQTPAFAENAFPPERSIELFTLTVIGGIGSLPGALLGAAFVEGLPLLPGLRDIDQIRLLTSGLGLLFILNFLPGGLAEGMFRVRDRFLRAVAVRRNIHVPSLIADSLVEAKEHEAADHAIAAAATTTEIAEAVDAGDLEHVIACPQCGELVPVADAQAHEHFRVGATNGSDHATPHELRLERLSK
ncbi:MAG: branched-chain amino acid transport system permease protein livM [Acidimicrobiaceae bacterium]|jgi:branched-chain amino acid transport system permease protein